MVQWLREGQSRAFGQGSNQKAMQHPHLIGQIVGTKFEGAVDLVSAEAK